MFKGDRQLTPLVGNLMQSEFEIISGFLHPIVGQLLSWFSFLSSFQASQDNVLFSFLCKFVIDQMAGILEVCRA